MGIDDAIKAKVKLDFSKEINVKIKLHSKYVSLLRKGDLIDLNYCGLMIDKVAEEYDIKYYEGDIFRVSLGVSMQLPEGKMAEIFARSSTQDKFHVMLTNAVGQIENLYNGSGDLWMAELIATDCGEMKLGDRILQFKITDVMPEVVFEIVDNLDNNNDRGGFGSTGK